MAATTRWMKANNNKMFLVSDDEQRPWFDVDFVETLVVSAIGRLILAYGSKRAIANVQFDPNRTLTVLVGQVVWKVETPSLDSECTWLL